MFKSEAKLFFSANNNVSYAKTIINDCKRLINEMEVDSSHYNSCKNNINGCNIDSLVTIVEDTKESLMKLDQTFANEYMQLLQEYLQTDSIDTSKMTEEEKMQYSIQMSNAYRDYNYNILYMLEKLEDAGALTPELEKEIETLYGTNLEYQREIIAQYELQDKMAVLMPTSQEYINLFKENAEYDRKIINLNPNLTEEQKASYLKEYETQYDQNLNVLQQARETKLKNEQLEKELQELYASKEENDGFWHPFVESEIDEAILDKKIEIGEFNPNSPYAASDDEIAYKNMNGWDRFWTDAATVAVSTFTGLYGVTENIEDGLVMLGGKIGICDKNWAAAHVSENQSEMLYGGIVISTGMNNYSAYSKWHDTGTFVGDAAGSIMLQFLPGGVLTMTAAHTLKGVGSGSEYALQKGSSFDDAFSYGSWNGAIEGVSALFLYGKFNSGTKMLDVFSKNPISNVFGKITKKLASYGTNGFQKYIGKYASEKFASKLMISSLKEYAKEINSYTVDGEIDLKKASLKARQAMITTTFNELVVSPLTDKVASKTMSNKYNKADQEYKKYMKRQEHCKNKIEKIKKQDEMLSENHTEQLLQDAQTSKMNTSSLNTNNYLEKLNREFSKIKIKLDHAYDNITLWDILVKDQFVNKFAKKVGSKVMSEVYN